EVEVRSTLAAVDIETRHADQDVGIAIAVYIAVAIQADAIMRAWGSSGYAPGGIAHHGIDGDRIGCLRILDLDLDDRPFDREAATERHRIGPPRRQSGVFENRGPAEALEDDAILLRQRWNQVARAIECDDQRSLACDALRDREALLEAAFIVRVPFDQ